MQSLQVLTWEKGGKNDLLICLEFCVCEWVSMQNAHTNTEIRMEMFWLKAEAHPSWELTATAPFKNLKRFQK